MALNNRKYEFFRILTEAIDTESSKILFETTLKNTSLFTLAAKYSDIEILKYLFRKLNSNQDSSEIWLKPDACGNIPLIYAILNSDTKAVELFLDQLKNKDNALEIIDSSFATGRMIDLALSLPHSEENIKIVNALLSSGANVLLSDKNQIPTWKKIVDLPQGYAEEAFLKIADQLNFIDKEISKSTANLINRTAAKFSFVMIGTRVKDEDENENDDEKFPGFSSEVITTTNLPEHWEKLNDQEKTEVSIYLQNKYVTTEDINKKNRYRNLLARTQLKALVLAEIEKLAREYLKSSHSQILNKFSMIENAMNHNPYIMAFYPPKYAKAFAQSIKRKRLKLGSEYDNSSTGDFFPTLYQKSDKLIQVEENRQQLRELKNTINNLIKGLKAQRRFSITKASFYISFNLALAGFLIFWLIQSVKLDKEEHKFTDWFRQHCLNQTIDSDPNDERYPFITTAECNNTISQYYSSNGGPQFSIMASIVSMLFVGIIIINCSYDQYKGTKLSLVKKDLSSKDFDTIQDQFVDPLLNSKGFITSEAAAEPVINDAYEKVLDLAKNLQIKKVSIDDTLSNLETSANSLEDLQVKLLLANKPLFKADKSSLFAVKKPMDEIEMDEDTHLLSIV